LVLTDVPDPAARESPNRFLARYNFEKEKKKKIVQCE
jgi:hypothetical protein